MVSKSVPVKLKGGLEPRPVAMLVQLASQHDSTIHIEVDGKKVNAKSIMGMMSLGLKAGEKVKLVADGDDEFAAIESLEKYFCSAQ